MTDQMSRLLPLSRSIVWDQDAMQGSDPKAQAAYLRKLVNDLQNMYSEIAIKHNMGPQYMAQAAQPTPTPGQMLVWKDTGAGGLWLLFNDNGTVSKTELT